MGNNSLRLLALFAVFIGGCTTIPPQVQKEIDDVKAQTKKDIADSQAATEKKFAAAEANPSAHPIAASESFSAGIRKPAAAIFFLALIAVGVFVGLKFTILKPISAIGLPVAIGVLGATFLGAVVLPFFTNPIAEFISLLAVVGFVVYEVIQNRHNIGGIIANIETEIKPVVAASAAAHGIAIPLTAPLPPNPAPKVGSQLPSAGP